MTPSHVTFIIKEEPFFIDAFGGIGKTFLTNLLLATIRKISHVALAVASSGIAATLLTGSRTAHSVFKLCLNIDVTGPVDASVGRVAKTLVQENFCKHAALLSGMNAQCHIKML